MKKGENRKKITYGTVAWIVAMICFLFLVGFTSWCQNGKTAEQDYTREYAMVVLGDSIMGEQRDETSISSQMSELLDISVFNGALGGTSLSRSEQKRRIGYTKDGLSVVALAEAIASKDFGVQQTVRIRENATEYFAETIDVMEEIDFEQTEVLLICAGVNDYHAGTKIYPAKDAYDQYTFVGALRSCIRDIKQAYPDMRIVIVTPTYAWYLAKDLTCEEFNGGGGYLEEYVEAELEVAAEMEVDVINLYHDFYSHDSWEDWQKYTTDGLHPNETSRTKIAETISTYLKATDIKSQRNKK